MTEINPQISARKSRRIGLWSVIAGSLSLVIVWFTWECFANHRLQTRLAALRAAHEPITVEELQPHWVPKEQNAAELLMQAADFVAKLKPPDKFYGDSKTPTFSDAWHHDIADPFIAKCSDALELVHKARQFPQSDWSRSPLFQLSRMERLIYVVVDAADVAHRNGNDIQALEYFQDAQNVSDSLTHGYLIDQLLSEVFEQITLEQFVLIQPQFKFAVNGSTVNGSISRSQAREFLELLSDESQLRDERHMLARWQFAYAYDGISERAAACIMLKPAVQLMTAELLDEAVQSRHAAEAEDFPTTARELNSISYILTESLAQELSIGITTPNISLSSNIRKIWVVVARRRATAIAFAAQLYRFEHKQWPTALRELVPDYLPALPANPFDSSGASFAYSVNADPISGKSKPILTIDDFEPRTTTRPTSSYYSIELSD